MTLARQRITNHTTTELAQVGITSAKGYHCRTMPRRINATADQCHGGSRQQVRRCKCVEEGLFLSASRQAGYDSVVWRRLGSFKPFHTRHDDEWKTSASHGAFLLISPRCIRRFPFSRPSWNTWALYWEPKRAGRPQRVEIEGWGYAHWETIAWELLRMHACRCLLGRCHICPPVPSAEVLHFF
ncbi:hypothetical protein COEREDRAFT_9152 [Coemansia reversa NRRL 1564]|uniref:Uncharacterized protein n=1 Tax=Coemansia reversa (strain ATCC 12441 / NRRL 1564) TaxID=763665 RepID=A0A2G5B9I3_COERN|nr:hypothetical protein COEREDRAFT_9152 [Coemansia reversa NRRL 1564]|eukprot:PIA15683.1 hypothetical protein COEREDRAFT_9152 [Coemansia reversa NRRL 1564]